MPCDVYHKFGRRNSSRQGRFLLKTSTTRCWAHNEKPQRVQVFSLFVSTVQLQFSRNQSQVEIFVLNCCLAASNPYVARKGGVIVDRVFLETVGSPSRIYQTPHNLGEQDESQEAAQNPCFFFGLHFCLARTGGFTSEETWALPLLRFQRSKLVQNLPQNITESCDMAGARSMFSTVFPGKKNPKKGWVMVWTSQALKKRSF